MKNSLITSGLLTKTKKSARSAFAEANCQAHPHNELFPLVYFKLKNNLIYFNKILENYVIFLKWIERVGGKKILIFEFFSCP